MKSSLYIYIKETHYLEYLMKHSVINYIHPGVENFINLIWLDNEGNTSFLDIDNLHQMILEKGFVSVQGYYRQNFGCPISASFDLGENLFRIDCVFNCHESNEFREILNKTIFNLLEVNYPFVIIGDVEGILEESDEFLNPPEKINIYNFSKFEGVVVVSNKENELW